VLHLLLTYNSVEDVFDLSERLKCHDFATTDTVGRGARYHLVIFFVVTYM